MAEYRVNLSDNSKTITIPENVVDKDKTSIALVGHGQPNYGEPQNENFLHMLEHFSSDREPNMPIKGQIWFKQKPENNTYELKVCRKSATRMIDSGKSDAVWDKLLRISSEDEGEPTNPTTGDIWYDSVNHQFKVYDETLTTDSSSGQWNVIGPEDVIHTETENKSSISTSSETSKSFVIDKSSFKDIINDEELEEYTHTGSLHLVTLKVLIKEVAKSQDVAIDSLRSCAMIYRFVVRVLSAQNSSDPTKSIYDISIFGAPNYEIIAKSDNLTFTTSVEIQGGNAVFTIDNTSATESTYFVNGIDCEITRV